MVLTSDMNSLKERAYNVIIGGGQGHKRGTDISGYPEFAVRGDGCRFWDDQGREFIDYLGAFGPILLGYRYPQVDDAVKRQIDEGVIFNIPHPAEVELAEKLVSLIPCAEMVSFFTGGSGATTGAIRIARAYTGREKIVRCGYHGWHDWCATGDRGVPQCVKPLTAEFNYNDLEGLRQIFRQHGREIACVIMEPIIGSGPATGFLEGVKAVCEKYGALLIFDEVKTGFRFALGGAQAYLCVTPHLATFGKAMANGYDIGVLVGPKNILSKCEDVWLAATFHAHLTGIAASLATIDVLEKNDTIQFLWNQGKKLMNGLDEIALRCGIDAHCVGYSPMPFLKFADDYEEVGRKFWEGTVKRGVYFSPGHVWFISASHNDEIIQKTLQASEEAMKEAAG